MNGLNIYCPLFKAGDIKVLITFNNIVCSTIDASVVHIPQRYWELAVKVTVHEVDKEITHGWIPVNQVFLFLWQSEVG